MRKFNVNVNGKDYIVEIEEINASEKIAKPAQIKQEQVKPQPQKTGNVNIQAPMNGTILDVSVSIGQQVKAGQVICILEAMKMENEIVAPEDGTVASVVEKGATVNTGDTLASLN